MTFPFGPVNIVPEKVEPVDTQDEILKRLEISALRTRRVLEYAAATNNSPSKLDSEDK